MHDPLAGPWFEQYSRSAYVAGQDLAKQPKEYLEAFFDGLSETMDKQRYNDLIAYMRYERVKL